MGPLLSLLLCTRWAAGGEEWSKWPKLLLTYNWRIEERGERRERGEGREREKRHCISSWYGDFTFTRYCNFSLFHFIALESSVMIISSFPLILSFMICPLCPVSKNHSSHFVHFVHFSPSLFSSSFATLSSSLAKYNCYCVKWDELNWEQVQLVTFRLEEWSSPLLPLSSPLSLLPSSLFSLLSPLFLITIIKRLCLYVCGGWNGEV